MRWPLSARGPASRANALRNSRGTAERSSGGGRRGIRSGSARPPCDGRRSRGGRRCGQRRRRSAPAAGRARGAHRSDRPRRESRSARPRSTPGRSSRAGRDRARGRHRGGRRRTGDDGRARRPAGVREAPPTPIGAGGYDVVVGDLLYSQLLYPALRDTTLPRERIGVVLARIDRPLVASVVRRLHASARRAGSRARARSARLVGRSRAAGVARRDPGGSRERRGCGARLVARGHGPSACDPRAIALEAGVPMLETVFWRWPFQRGVDYLASATVTLPGAPPLH